ncbi:MAG: 1-acyl-sn-glycerol-3-phosphate acyltransferase [Mycobacteriaceae bacterium]|nr:1-acyl-sn-glycerol-3-phosphate acyltransferase [Mycobacteriaceae bacterium]
MTHAWMPRASCDGSCVRVAPTGTAGRVLRAWRVTYRSVLALTMVPVMPILAVPLPGQARIQRVYCRLLVRCLGVRITKSGGPIRNVPGVLVVSSHMSWLDVLVIGALLPGAFVAKAELVNWLGLGHMARLLSVIPIDRTRLRQLPGVVDTIAERLRGGQTVVAFPEGTTFCGLAYGPFRPALFQAAIDAGRPVQPVRLTYHHRDGRPSTLPAYIGTDTLGGSFVRLVTARRTIAHVRVEALQLPGDDRRDLSRRCEAAVRGTAAAGHDARAHALAA